MDPRTRGRAVRTRGVGLDPAALLLAEQVWAYPGFDGLKNSPFSQRVFGEKTSLQVAA